MASLEENSKSDPYQVRRNALIIHKTKKNEK